MNKIQLIGNLGRDAEMTYTQSMMAVTKFSIGVSRGTKNPDGSWNNETDWFNIVAFKDLAERAAPLSKGKRVYVEGKINMRKYTDKNGVEKLAVDVIADKIHIVTALSSASNAQEQSIDPLGALDEHPF